MLDKIILPALLLLASPLGAGAATVQLPQTGQTLCYDAASAPEPCPGTGQDGEFKAGAAWPTPRFTNKGDGTILDKLTGLVWLKDANCGDLAPTGAGMAGAIGAANALHAGQCALNDGSTPGTWRLANANELESLIDLSQTGPALPTSQLFDNVQSSFYWSSTVEAVYPNNGIAVNLGTGALRGDVRTAHNYVWPVKGASNELPRTGQHSCWSLDGSSLVDCTGTGADGDLQAGAVWPDPRFSDNGDGTVSDLLTGLIWLKKADCFPVTGSQALAIQKSHSLADGTCNLSDGSAPGTWRLPNRKQLRSLINYQGSNGASWLNSQGFTNTQDGWYWTSDASPGTGTGDCWLIKTEGGEWPTSWWAQEQASNPPQPQYLLPVRGPLPVAGITLGNLNQTYDGTPKTPSATTVPAGLQVVYSYNGSQTAPSGAGSYGVVATIKDPNYQGTVGDTLVIGKAGATLVLDPASLTQSYDGTGKSVTATTVPPGLAVNFDYDGGASPPAGAGSYAVVATVVSANYTGNASGTLVITKANAAVTLAGLNQTYDGTPKGVSATTVPPGTTVTFSYNGNAAPPTGAGSYPVVATIVDANYQGTANGTLAIAKASATVVLDPASLSQTYDGTPKSASATTVPAGTALTFSYNGNAAAPTGAGSYTVQATVNDANFQGNASGTLAIAKASAAVTLAGLSQGYDGTPKSASATTVPPGKPVGFSYNGSAAPPTGVGSYAVVGTVGDANYQGSASGTLTIGKGSASVTLAGLSQVYDGTPKSAGATTVPPGTPLAFSYNGSASPPTGAGSYQVVATVSDPSYQGSANGTLTIAKANAAVTLAGLNQSYDGTPKSAAAATVPAGLALTISYGASATPPAGAGSYPVAATVADANYQGSASDTLTIAKAGAAVTLDPASLNQSYDGTPKSAAATTVPAGKTVTFSYNGSATAPVEAGSYLVVGNVSDPNFSGTATGTLAVQKVTTPISWAAPAPIVAGTALSAAQLDASTGVPGTFAYTPALGSVPGAGTQLLSALFTPTNTASYTVASAQVSLTVIPTYQVSYLSGGNGTLSGATGQTVVSGASASEVTAVVAANYHFAGWSGADGFSSTDNPLQLASVTSNQTVTALFALNSFLVGASATGGGTVSCTPSVNYGANALCNIAPAAGFHLCALSDNGVDRLSTVAGGSYTVSGVTGNHLISATFARPDGILKPSGGKSGPAIGDALAVYRIAMGLDTASAYDLAHADVAPLGPDGLPYGDGKLDIYDVMGILEMLLGLVQP